MGKPEDFVKDVKAFELPDGISPKDWARQGMDPFENAWIGKMMNANLQAGSQPRDIRNGIEKPDDESDYRKALRSWPIEWEASRRSTIA